MNFGDLINQVKGTQNLAPPLMPTIAMPSAAPALPPVSAPLVTQAPHVASPMELDQNRVNYLHTSGSGVDQIQNPLLKGIARAGDIAASVFAPGIARSIPGTTLHHNLLVGQAEKNLANDQASQRANADSANVQANADHINAETPEVAPNAASTRTLQGATARHLNDESDNLENPTPDPITLAQLHANAVNKAIQEGRDPSTDPTVNHLSNAIIGLQPGQNKPPAVKESQPIIGPDGKPHVYALDEQGNKVKDLGVHYEKPMSVNVNSGTWTPGFDANKAPVMFNSKTGEVKPMDGSFSKQNGVNAKIGADEQKRADMAQNLNENIDKLEDIAKRRPELFGPVAGRMTDAKISMGSSDPDVAQLAAINHQLGMAQMSAHSMRSAQGLEAASKSLVNSFHNSPAATLAGLEAARSSVATFLNNSQNPGQARGEAHVIQVGGKNYQYNGSGATDDMKNYTEVKK